MIGNYYDPDITPNELIAGHRFKPIADIPREEMLKPDEGEEMSVQRYECGMTNAPTVYQSPTMHQDANGGYVSYEDYAALEQQLAESHRALRAETTAHENVKIQLEKMAAENAGLNAFADALLSIAWNGCSADGAEIQEMALKHGLLRQETYSADEHENQVDDPGNFEDGDPVYFRVETPTTDAYLAEVRAQGVEMFADHLSGMNISASETSVREFAGAIRKGVQS